MTVNSAPAVYPLTLYYDGACPMCHAEMHNLMLRNQRQLLVFVDISVPGFSGQPPGATQQDLMTLIHASQADGTLVKGVDVFRLAYSAAGLPWVSALVRLPVIGPLVDRLYPWVARFRQRIPQRLVVLLFETAARRAAIQAAARGHCKPGDTCRF
jgi:predicted DCC family thiol-disulfide oxidoreductase YuxK